MGEVTLYIDHSDSTEALVTEQECRTQTENLESMPVVFKTGTANKHVRMKRRS